MTNYPIVSSTTAFEYNKYYTHKNDYSRMPELRLVPPPPQSETERIFKDTPLNTNSATIGLNYKELMEQNALLSKVALSLKTLLEYNSLYNTFLLGLVTEEEFLKLSDNFTIEKKTEYDLKKVEKEIKILHSFIKSKFTIAELSDILGYDEKTIEQAVKNNSEFKVCYNE